MCVHYGGQFMLMLLDERFVAPDGGKLSTANFEAGRYALSPIAALWLANNLLTAFRNYTETFGPLPQGVLPPSAPNVSDVIGALEDMLKQTRQQPRPKSRGPNKASPWPIASIASPSARGAPRAARVSRWSERLRGMHTAGCLRLRWVVRVTSRFLPFRPLLTPWRGPGLCWRAAALLSAEPRLPYAGSGPLRSIHDLSRAQVPVVVIMATNRLNALHPAIRRRAANVYDFQRPNDAQRAYLLEKLLPDLNLSETQLSKVVDATGRGHGLYGFSYSDIVQRLIRDALLTAFAEDRPLDADTLLRAAHGMQATPPF
jgi:SpoVK/Ycf46/Vps4 family AAA+-type ATPase